jgi:hypothetical protein
MERSDSTPSLRQNLEVERGPCPEDHILGVFTSHKSTQSFRELDLSCCTIQNVSQKRCIPSLIALLTGLPQGECCWTVSDNTAGHDLGKPGHLLQLAQPSILGAIQEVIRSDGRGFHLLDTFQFQCLTRTPSLACGSSHFVNSTLNHFNGGTVHTVDLKMNQQPLNGIMQFGFCGWS